MGRIIFLLAVLCVLSLPTYLPAQSIYGTLTGIVADPSNAVVPNAPIKLRDQQSGALRETVTNSEGYYTFASVPPGVYEITVSAPGFETYSQPKIALGGGDKVNINIERNVKYRELHRADDRDQWQRRRRKSKPAEQ